MIRLVLATACLALADAPSPAPDSYDAMKAAAGRDAASQVKLALWCEAHGLETQKLRHLAVAVLSDPSNAMARGLMGLVEYGGKWRRPEAVADALKNDVEHADLMAEYAGKRVRTPVKPDAQYKLALWCEEKGLKDEARAHLATVVRLDPNHAEAWKKLGYKKVGNRWITGAQAEREKTEKQLQQEADRRWRPRLERLREALDGKGERKEDAQRDLATITDPRAVPAVWHVFVERGGKHQVEAVQLLGQIDAIEASRGLAMLALASKSGEVRRRATETLRRRDPREWAGMLIVMLREKIKYEVKKVGGPGSPGELYIAGKEANLRRLYAPPPAPTLALLPTDTLDYDELGLPIIVRHQVYTATGSANLGRTTPAEAQRVLSQLTPSPSSNPFAGTLLANSPEARVFADSFSLYQSQVRQNFVAKSNLNLNEPGRVNTFVEENELVDHQTMIPIGRMVAEAERAAAGAEQQLEQDVRQIEAINASVRSANERLAQVLNAATGANLPAEAKPWTSWYSDQLGIRYNLMTEAEPSPTLIENVPLNYAPQAVPLTEITGLLGATPVSIQRHSCFGRGTIVRTISGSKAIETIAVGDLILTQDAGSGGLAYHPVVMIHHNPPSPTFRIHLGSGAVVTSPSHRFWVAGRGWVMARDLKVGDPIRTLGGVAKVEKIETGEVQPVFNLDVADDADFFAGDSAALVHDNTLPDLKQVPFDAPPAVAVK